MSSIFNLECQFGEDKVLTAYVRGKGRTKPKDLTERMKLAYHHGNGVIVISDNASLFHMTFPDIFGLEALPVGLCKIGNSYKKGQATVVELIPVGNASGNEPLHKESLPETMERLTVDVPLLRPIPWDDPIQITVRLATSLIFMELDKGKTHKSINKLSICDPKYFDIMSKVKVKESNNELGEAALESIRISNHVSWKNLIQITRVSKIGVEIKMILMPILTNISLHDPETVISGDRLCRDFEREAMP